MDSTTPTIYTLSLHDALPIYLIKTARVEGIGVELAPEGEQGENRSGPTIAEENKHELESHPRAVGSLMLDLCYQPPGSPSEWEAKTISVNSENRHLFRCPSWS